MSDDDNDADDVFAMIQERGGSSRHAILKYIVTHYKIGQDERAINSHLKLALRSGVKNGLLKQSKGSGAAGSFRLGDKAEKKAAKKPKAAAAKKPKSPKKAKKPKKVSIFLLSRFVDLFRVSKTKLISC